MVAQSKETTTEGEFVISRVFDAPRELVWKVCTDPAHLTHWLSPRKPGADSESSMHVAKMDFRVGGTYHYCMKTPHGDMWGKMVYREIVPPERIVFIQSFSDEKGGLAPHPMSPTWPLEMLSTFTFTEQGGKTTFTVKWLPYNATEEQRKTFDDGRKGMQGGWGSSLDNLTEYLAKLRA
jgi:uncharacterized protein YndB with AHSA1/START domain